MGWIEQKYPDVVGQSWLIITKLGMPAKWP
jgi:hypothetical protein